MRSQDYEWAAGNQSWSDLNRGLSIRRPVRSGDSETLMAEESLLVSGHGKTFKSPSS